MAYKYTREEWSEINRRREEEDRAQAIAYAEDMDQWSFLRQEEHASKHLLTSMKPSEHQKAA